MRGPHIGRGWTDGREVVALHALMFRPDWGRNRVHNIINMGVGSIIARLHDPYTLNAFSVVHCLTSRHVYAINV